jgi:hypothetical protein
VGNRPSPYGAKEDCSRTRAAGRFSPPDRSTVTRNWPKEGSKALTTIADAEAAARAVNAEPWDPLPGMVPTLSLLLRRTPERRRPALSGLRHSPPPRMTAISPISTAPHDGTLIRLHYRPEAEPVIDYWSRTFIGGRHTTSRSPTRPRRGPYRWRSCGRPAPPPWCWARRSPRVGALAGAVAPLDRMRRIDHLLPSGA